MNFESRLDELTQRLNDITILIEDLESNKSEIVKEIDYIQMLQTNAKLFNSIGSYVLFYPEISTSVFSNLILWEVTDKTSDKLCVVEYDYTYCDYEYSLKVSRKVYNITSSLTKDGYKMVSIDQDAYSRLRKKMMNLSLSIDAMNNFSSEEHELT